MRPVDDTCGGEPGERRRPVEERSMAVELVDASVTEPAPVPAGSGALEEAFQEAYLRRISKERPAAEVPAAAPVTEPSPAPVTRNLRGTWSVHTPMSVHRRGAYGDRRDLQYTPSIILQKDGVYIKDGRIQKGILERTEDPPLMD